MEQTATIGIGGMTCSGCRNKIEKKLRGADGVRSASVSLAKGTASIVYDDSAVTLRELESAIERLGYSVRDGSGRGAPAGKAAGLVIILFAAYTLLRRFGLTDFLNVFPEAEDSMGYGALFVVGLLTSAHCAAMCGGINLSQSLGGTGGGGAVALRPCLLYNGGRAAAYTLVGGVAGALGSVFTLTGAWRGVIQLAAGAFMVIMGLNMLGMLRGLRRFMPRLPSGLARRLGAGRSKSAGPLVIGLLNGLMPCGPLQAMQLYALSSGSPAKGALSMLLFSLGTVPLMFGLGALGSVLSRKLARYVTAAGAALVVVLGLAMFSRGWSLSGFSLGALDVAGLRSPGAAVMSEAVAGDGYQTVSATLRPGSYPAITVRAGIPVKWTIDAPPGSINGCNNRLFIPKYDVEHEFTAGENVIEFTPSEAGTVRYSCWMGMIRGTITVVEAEGGYENG
ncbi:MAG: sulfite exporter TauE/SafE family protein [Oscillospiraceae bacterium]|jgi:sulfite exporter TauE/SafE/copper chaperone CopZ|nr:sulfite exporter TauE/SafE family protein [Oscillospiraceae bacterium]